MRYYEDGTLKQGLQIAPKAYPHELVAGLYHVVWAKTTELPEGESEEDGSQYDDGQIFRYSTDRVNFLSIEKAGPESDGHKPYQMIFGFEGLRLRGSFKFRSAVSTIFTLQEDSLTNRGAFAAQIYVGIVLDDQGFPFLKYRATYTDPNDKILRISECVAKKTTVPGLKSNDLTKNEKLRLGFPIPENKATQPKPNSEDSPEDVVRNLGRYAGYTASQIGKVQRLRDEMNDQLRTSRAVLQDAVDLSLDVPADSDPEDRPIAIREPKRKRTRN